MRTKAKIPPAPQPLFNLEEHNSNQSRHVATRLWNVPYAMCKSLMDRLKVAPKLPGTFFKITPSNRTQIA